MAQTTEFATETADIPSTKAGMSKSQMKKMLITFFHIKVIVPF
jgi:hypothetical protein